MNRKTLNLTFITTYNSKKDYGVLTTAWTKKPLPFFPAAYSCLIIGAIKFCAIVNIIKSLLKLCIKRFTDKKLKNKSRPE